MAKHKTANASEIEVKTPPLTVQVGLTPLAVNPRPDLAGLRVKLPNQGAIYLIDPEGYRRWIPNPQTYNNLFRDWNGVVIDISINDIAVGSPLTDGAVLVLGFGSHLVYIVSNGVRRWITSQAALDKYYFNWNNVFQVPHVLVDSIPQGNFWS